MEKNKDKDKTPAEKGEPSASAESEKPGSVSPEEGGEVKAAAQAEAPAAADEHAVSKDEPAETPAPEPEEQQAPETPEPRPVSHQADRPASPGWLMVLALLVAVIALVLAARLYMQQQVRVEQQLLLQERVENEFERIRATADDSRRAIEDFRKAIDDSGNAADDARQAIDEAIQSTRRSNSELRALVDEERSRQGRELAEQRRAVAAVEDALRSQRQQTTSTRSADRVDWSLAETEYLLRLAFQRLLLAKDVTSAIALLDSADAILRELDDTELLPAREAIARDLAALRAIPDIDVDGTWLRLQALAERVDSLLLFELGVDEAPATELPEDAGWQERLQQGFSAAIAKISSYIVIRRREQPYETLIDPQWEQMVRQNLRMQIAQSQAALLSGNPELYRLSLTSTRRWMQEFFDFNQSDVTAMDAELDALMAVQITREYPNIGGSLSAVKAAIDARHSVRGGG